MNKFLPALPGSLALSVLAPAAVFRAVTPGLGWILGVAVFTHQFHRLTSMRVG